MAWTCIRNPHDQPDLRKRHFKLLDFKANFAKFDIANIPEGEKVTIYVETMSNDHINGNQFYNVKHAPHQLEINYIGTNALKLNGTADINAFVYAPKVGVTTNGNFNYYGALKALSFTVSGNARINADETIVAAPVVSDIKFSLHKTSQYYW